MAKHHGVEDTDWGLYADEKRDLTVRKSIKVLLPLRQHIKLHALKLLGDSNISQTVEAALDLYFAKVREEDQAAKLMADPGGMAFEMLPAEARGELGDMPGPGAPC